MANVKMYTTTYCPYCKLAKKFFDENNVAFQEVNVENDQKELEEMVKKSGQMGVPVIDVDGNIVIGFNKKKLEQLLLK